MSSTPFVVVVKHGPALRPGPLAATIARVHRTRVVLGSLAGAVAVHFSLVACGTLPARLDAGADASADTLCVDAVVDAIAEASRDVLARETSSADAQRMDAGAGPMEAPCVAQASGAAFASFSVPGLRASDVPQITAHVCQFLLGFAPNRPIDC